MMVPEVLVTVATPVDVTVEVWQTVHGFVSVIVVEPPVGTGETTTV